MTTPNPQLKAARNEVWLVNFDPTTGDEIQKTRPAVIISVSAAFRHRLQIVVRSPVGSKNSKMIFG